MEHEKLKHYYDQDFTKALYSPDYCVDKVKDTMFTQFVTERMNAFHSRQKGCVYVSKFSCINNTRFTNPYRMLDRVSQYVIQEITCNETFGTNANERLFRLYLLRLYNQPSTYELILQHLKMKGFNIVRLTENKSSTMVQCIREKMEALTKADYKLYRQAYVRWTGLPYIRSLDILDDFDESYNALRASYLNSENLYDLYYCFTEFLCFGTFLSYQLALDVQYMGNHDNKIDFVVPGPGAQNGLRMIYGQMHIHEMIQVLKTLTVRQNEWLGKEWKPYVHFIGGEYKKIPLQVNDVQNLFCEFSKFFGLHVLRSSGGAANRRLRTDPVPLSIQLPENIINLTLVCPF